MQDRLFTVLVVDDDADTLEAIRMLFDDEGYSVECFATARGALDWIVTGATPSVALLDFRMPDMNGAEFVHELTRAGVRVPVLLFTAAQSEEVLALSRRVAGIIRKPVNIEDLLHEVARVAFQPIALP